MSGDHSRWVLDASVGIKLVVFEDDTEKAVAFIQKALDPHGPTLYVPDIFYAECSNVLWKYSRKSDLSLKEAKAQLADLAALPIQVVSNPAMMMEAFELALELEVSAYDALYVVITRKLNAILVTADRKLAAKLRGSKIQVNHIV